MTRFLAVLSGVLLAVAVAVMVPWAAVPAALLVLVGWRVRVGAVAAVLVALAALVWADGGAAAAAGTGLVATTYLLTTATVRAPHGVVPTTVPSVAGALLFALAAVAAVAATLLPGSLAWAPLAAPVLVIALFALIVRGLSGRRTGPAG